MAANLIISTQFRAEDKYTGVVRKMTRSTSSFANKTVGAFKRVNAATNRVIGGMANLQNAAVVAISGVAIKKAYDLATGVAEVGDEAAKTGKMLGLTAESLQEFRFAADRQGVSSSTLESSFLALTKRTGELKLGTGSLYSFLNKTGNKALIDQLKNTNNTEEAFALLTKEIEKIEDPTKKAAFASAAFSRSGIAMTKVMDAGSEGIAALREEARMYGGVMSNEAAASSEGFLDAQTNMDFAIKGLTNTLGSELMPHIKAIIESITNWVTANKDIIKTNIDSFISKVSNAISFLKDNSDILLTTLKFVAGAFLAMKAGILAYKGVMLLTEIAQVAYNVAGGITIALTKGATVATNASKVAHAAYAVTTGIVTVAQWLFNAALTAGAAAMTILTSPITLVILGILALTAAVAAIIYYWEDIVKWVKMSDNVFAEFIRNSIDKLSVGLEYIVELWGKIKNSGFVKGIGKAVNAVSDFFGDDDDDDDSNDEGGNEASEDNEKTKKNGFANKAGNVVGSVVDAFGGGEPLNPAATIEKIRTERSIKTENQKVDININDKTNRAEIEGNTGGNIKMTNTLGI